MCVHYFLANNLPYGCLSTFLFGYLLYLEKCFLTLDYLVHPFTLGLALAFHFSCPSVSLGAKFLNLTFLPGFEGLGYLLCDALAGDIFWAAGLLFVAAPPNLSLVSLTFLQSTDIIFTYVTPCG